jgi:AcrR family transcriptional regulator
MPAYHFGSKDELVARLARQGNEKTMAATAAAVERAHGDLDSMPTLQSLRAIIETYLDVLTGSDGPEERAVVVMWGASLAAESPLSAVRQSDRETHELLTGFIGEGQSDGSIRSDVDPAAAAALVMGMARGIAGLSLSHPDVADTADVRRLCGEAISATLAPESRPRRTAVSPTGAPRATDPGSNRTAPPPTP